MRLNSRFRPAMISLFLLGLLLGGLSTGFAAEGDEFEYRAVALGKNEEKASRKLNDLIHEGWEIVGVLGNNLTAFRRKIEQDAPSPSDVVPKPLEANKEEPKEASVAPTTPDLPAMMPAEKPIVPDVPKAPAPGLDAPALPDDLNPQKSVLKKASDSPEDLPQVAMSSAPDLPESKKPAKPDGTWTLITYAMNGHTIRQQDSRCTWEVDGDHWTSRWISSSGKPEVAAGELKFHAEKDGLVQVDLLHTAGAYKGQVTYAVMQTSGDYVKYCYTADAKTRPGEFVTTEGDHRGLVLWQKVK